MDRRQFLKNTTAALTTAGIGVAPWRSAQAQAGPIKIGLLAPLTGVVASGGKEMVEGVLMMIAGGVGTLFGAFVGAAAIIALENVVSAYTERWQMVLGITFILIMIFAPEGIIGKLRAILTRKVR